MQRLLEDIPLEPLSPSHIEDVARLHYRLLPWSFNGQFGEAHIIDLYSAPVSYTHLDVYKRQA